MKLFKFGKSEKGQQGEKSEKDNVPFLSEAGGVASVAALGEKDSKLEKKKKKSKDAEGTGPGAASAPPRSAGMDGGDAAGRGAGGPPARGQMGLSVNDFISKTKNQQRQGLKPSGPELIAYARYLGIDPVADHDLLWIATEALEAPLPSDWTEHFDSNDRVFYYNATMRVSSWTHPLEHIYRETYKTIVNHRNANMSAQDRAEKLHQLQQEVRQMEHDVHKEISQWTEHTDEQGNKFYFNREERQSTWTDPRPAKCQILYLRMKMLRLLQSGSGATPGFSDSKAALDFDNDQALKRPKHGIGREKEANASKHSELDENPLDRHNASVSDVDSDKGSDSDEGGKKKKKKKKKKKNKSPKDQVSNISRDEGSSAAGGAGGASTPMDGFEKHSENTWTRNAETIEGLSTVGRVRVKAGIRLEPIGSPGGPAGDISDNSPGVRPGGKGVSNSASMPMLRP